MEREFGKFESSKELLHAYLELEKEYTRKCQKLAELLRKFEDAKIDSNAQNAEFCAENDEHSIKNAQNHDTKMENCDCVVAEKLGGIIANEDACCNSTSFVQVANSDTTGVEKNREAQNGNLNDADEKKPIYLSPLFGFLAKEFFAASVLAGTFEKEILNLVATDFEISCMPNALETAAERIVGREIMQPVLCDKFVEALCTLPQIKQKVIDMYVAKVRSKGLPPASVRIRSGAATTRAKFSSIEDASKHLLSRL